MCQVEDVKKEISDFMQSQSVAKEMTETDAAMVSMSNSPWRQFILTKIPTENPTKLKAKKYYKFSRWSRHV